MVPTKCLGPTIICLAAFLALCAGYVSAGEKAEAAFDQSHALMALGRYAEATAVLVPALREAPTDTRLWYFLGTAYNALGQYADALKALRMAEKLRHDSPRFRQELGDALLGMGRAREALAELEKGPDTARNRMARAMALIRLKRPREALPLLDEALAKAPKLEPRIRLMRSSALSMMGKAEEADAEFAAGKLKATDPFSRLMYEAIERSRLQAARAGARWGYQLTFGTGYNDNVTLLPDEATGVLAQELSNEQDAFIMESATAWFRLHGDQRRGVIARAAVTAIQHEDLHDFDSMQLSGGLLAYCTHGPLRFEAGCDLGYTEVDYQTFAHTYTGYATARWAQAPWSRSNLTYYLSHRDFKFTVLADENRDGQLHIVRLTQELSLPVADRRIYVAPFAEFGVEDTQGRSSENDFWGVGAHVRCPVVRRVDAFASVGYRDRDYDHTHIRSAFVTKRSDHEWRMGAGLQCALSDHAILTAEWSRVNANSNLPEFFSFDQDVFLLSITFYGP